MPLTSLTRFQSAKWTTNRETLAQAGTGLFLCVSLEFPKNMEVENRPILQMVGLRPREGQASLGRDEAGGEAHGRTQACIRSALYISQGFERRKTEGDRIPDSRGKAGYCQLGLWTGDKAAGL